MLCKMSKNFNNILVLYKNRNKSVIRDCNKYRATCLEKKKSYTFASCLFKNKKVLSASLDNCLYLKLIQLPFWQTNPLVFQFFMQLYHPIFRCQTLRWSVRSPGYHMKAINVSNYQDTLKYLTKGVRHTTLNKTAATQTFM